MAHLFICPNCGNRSSAGERSQGFRNVPKGCSKCGFGFLFELLDDYYPAPNAAFFVCDHEGRIIGCGRGSRELSAETLRHVPRVGEPATLHTHLIVRDDALLLYGFATEEERDLFLLLIGVQSVGPKMALAVLSGGPPRELLGAVAAGDTARLQAVPGIGKRTAERIVVELREKVGVPDGDDPIVITRGDDPRLLARDGLVGLGFTLQEADALLSAAAGDTPEALIAAALREARP